MRKVNIGMPIPDAAKRAEGIERTGGLRGPPYYSKSPTITHLRSLYASGRRLDAIKWALKIGSASTVLFLLRLPNKMRIKDDK